MSEHGLSLYIIDKTLHDLISMREDVATDEERAAIDSQIIAWTEQSVAKVDNVRSWIRYCQVQESSARQLATQATIEAEMQTNRADRWKNQADRMKQICLSIMEARGITKLEGQSGRLRIQAVGGKRALEITSQSLIPDEYTTMRGMITWRAWRDLKSMVASTHSWEKWAGREDVQMERQPNNEMIRAALEKDETSVPGARLAERGKSLRVD